MEPQVFNTMLYFAKREGVSISTIARDLIREAIEQREDDALEIMADKRMKTSDKRRALSHEGVWE